MILVLSLALLAHVPLKGQQALLLETPKREEYVAAVGALQDKMTERERAAGRLFARYRMEGAGLLMGRSVFITAHEGVASSPVRPSLADRYGPAFCRAGAVVIGRVVAARSHPIEDGTFLFTDYQMVPSEIFRNPRKPALLTGRSVSVYRPGGSLTLGGTPLFATRWDLPGLTVGKDYLLFLTYTSDLDALLSTESEDVFEVANGVATTLRPVALAGATTSRPEVGLSRLRQLFNSQYCRQGAKP
jgi:hypothetical protein